MPLRFRPVDDLTGSDGQSYYRTSLPFDDNAEFHVLRDNVDGECVVCHGLFSGPAWGGSHWVLCPSCAVSRGAPDLHTHYPDWFRGYDDQQYPDDVDEPTLREIIDDMDEEDGMPMTSKRDKAFDPAQYHQYMTMDQDFILRYGCSGYRCETSPMPERKLVRGVPFMVGTASRGHLCMPCFTKLKALWDATPRETCNYCDRIRAATGMVATITHGRVCLPCSRDAFMNCPQTDGGLVQRSGAQWCNIGGQRIYASLAYATSHWYRDSEARWWGTQEEADARLFTVDVAYRNDKLTRHVLEPVFAYGTNIIKMLGFPASAKKDDLVFGVELEMVPNATHDQRAVIGALNGKWVDDRPYILCRDGSIGDSGVEMITLPFTLDQHKSDKYVPWKDTLAKLRHVAVSGKVTKVCGMHIHINRRALSQLTMGKMLLIVNAPEMQELICCIAQRSDSGWAHRKVVKISDGKLIEGTHYDALNIATNKGTCELRIFRGNLRYERVMKNLEFAEALCMYAIEQSMQLIADPAIFVAWVHARKQYPHLSKFLTEHYKPKTSFKAQATLARRSGRWLDVARIPTMQQAETEGDI